MLGTVVVGSYGVIINFRIYLNELSFFKDNFRYHPIGLYREYQLWEITECKLVDKIYAEFPKSKEKLNYSLKILVRNLEVIRYVGFTPSIPKLPEAKVLPVLIGLSEA